MQDEVLARQRDIASGKLRPFAALRADIKDNEGKTAIAAGQSLDDGQILGMNWLVDGVQGKLSR